MSLKSTNQSIRDKTQANTRQYKYDNLVSGQGSLKKPSDDFYIAMSFYTKTTHSDMKQYNGRCNRKQTKPAGHCY